MIDSITPQYNLGTAYLNKGNGKRAHNILKSCLKEYECKEILVNLGNAKRLLGDDRGAMECYHRAIHPSVPCVDKDVFSHALNNLGLAYYTQGNDTLAMKYYTLALKVNPKFWDAWWNCSTCVLRIASSGNVHQFPRGWEMYNARFLKMSPVQIRNNKENLRYWKPGENVENLFILTEQGLGDSLMFGRYLPLLRQYAKNIYIQCPTELNDVFSDYNPSTDATNTNANVAYPICSLGSVFPDIIPPGDWLRGRYNARVFPEGFNVGIVWAGSNTHSNDRYRSTNIHRFHRLARHCNLWGLVPGFTGDRHVRSLGIKNWTDTAEAILGLDLVIGVDTSVIHMAGCLGAKAWLLQPMKETDFRWGNGVRHSVWYPEIEIFQNPNNWDVVFDNVEKALVNGISASDKVSDVNTDVMEEILASIRC